MNGFALDPCLSFGRSVEVMSRWPAVLLAFSFVGAAGCGDDEVGAPTSRASAQRAVETQDYVASPTLARGTAAQLFAIPGLGRFGARCNHPGEAEISYTSAGGSATQLVTTENRGLSSNGRLDPGQRMAVTIGRSTGPRVDWQVAVLSEGTVEVATASFTTGKLSERFGCFVTGKAQVSKRRR
jgi:hypothetical protein